MRKVFAVMSFLVLFLMGCTDYSEPKQAVIIDTWDNSWSSGTVVETMDGGRYARIGRWGEVGDTLTVVITDDGVGDPRWTSPGVNSN